MNDKEASHAAIEKFLLTFCESFLTPEAQPHLLALWAAAKRARKLDLVRGDPNIWAAGLAYAFARMNFLLDDEGPLHIERTAFFEFFDRGSRSSITQKATRIEKTLKFHHGHPTFSLPEVTDAMERFVELPNGMIMPESFLKLAAKTKETNEAEKLRLQEEARRKRALREEEKRRERHEALRRKREEERKTQPELFGFDD